MLGGIGNLFSQGHASSSANQAAQAQANQLTASQVNGLANQSIWASPNLQVGPMVQHHESVAKGFQVEIEQAEDGWVVVVRKLNEYGRAPKRYIAANIDEVTDKIKVGIVSMQLEK